MSNTSSKNSAFVNSLVGFTLDTKPYHSKLTEVAVEFRFDETMNVRIEDAVASRMVTKAGWMYGFTSGGPDTLRLMQLQRVVKPDVLRPRSETNGDMLGVPFVYAKKSTLGYAEVWKRGAQQDVLVRGHDYFHSYGSSEIRVSLAPANDTDQSRRWQPTNAEGVMAAVTTVTQQQALDVTNPSSPNRRIRSLLLQIQSQLALTPNPAATAELNALLAVINAPNLPRSYEALLNALEAGSTPVIAGFTGWIGEDNVPTAGNRYVDDALSQLTPPAFFNVFSDARLREGSTMAYPPSVKGPGFTVTGTTALSLTSPEEWRIEVTDISPLTLSVIGSIHGFIGSLAAGSSFTSPYITFNTSLSAGTPTVGAAALLTPVTRFAVASTSPTQVWNVIKTDPLAYSRPAFTSPRYGSIQNLSGALGKVSLLDVTLPTGTIVLTATSPTSFTLSSTAEPSYTGTVTVGTTFNDGRVGLRINAGSAQPYRAGDRFLIHVVNRPAEAVELDLYFGYDLDSYDNLASVYNNTDPLGLAYNQPLEFRYDSRFVDYDLTTFNLQVAQNAVPGRRFRLTALPNGAPVATLKKDGSGPSNAVDLTDPTTGAPPDPALNSPPVFSMPGDANPAEDLLVYYASSFKLEYSDDNFTTSTFVANVPVNGTYSSPSLGISFSLPNGSKPFIGVSSDDGLASPRVEGGDVFMWRVVNEPPVLEPSPVVFASDRVPYLLMHGDGFWDAPAAAWQVVFSSPAQYSVSALHTEGVLAGSPVAGYPKTGFITTTGTATFQNLTFKDDLVHFTIRPGAVPFAAGDTFSFSTFSRKPSLLVHGTVSGWQPEAVIGEWYWNGHVGFKVNLPVTRIFQGTGQLTTDLDPGDPDFSKISVTRVRPDTPGLVYTFTRLASSYLVERSDVGVIGYAALTGTFKDRYLSVALTNPAASFKVQVLADELQFWNAEDTIVVRPQISALLPKSGDVIAARKAEEGRLAIAVDYEQAPSPPSITPLFPLGIDDEFINVDTGPGNPPIEKHSPEAGIFDGWLPLLVEGMDATNSVAFFPDEATSLEVRSAATNQPVGKVLSLGTINEPVRFEWDEAFHTTYLPLNSRAFVVTYGTFLDEKVKVRMHERVNFLLSGGVLQEDALFTDRVNVAVADTEILGITTAPLPTGFSFVNPEAGASVTGAWRLRSTTHQADLASVTAADGPFDGFLAGYGNLPFDAEDATGTTSSLLGAAAGQWDTGSPLTDHFLRAQALSSLPSPTPGEAQELTDLLGLIATCLQPGGLSATTLEQFLDALDSDPFAEGGTAPEMGRPRRGLGIDLDKKDTDGASASFQTSATVLLSANTSAFDEEGFDTDGLDIIQDATALLVSPATPPVPAVPPSLTSYAAFETPLVVTVPTRSFILSFPAAVATIPTVTVWASTASSPVTVPVVDRLTSRSFSFNLAGQDEVKIAVT